MELEDIKEIWNKQVTDDHRSEEEMDEILKAKSKNPLKRIYRSMALELSAVILIFFSFGLMDYYSGKVVHYVSYSVLSILSIVIYWVYYRIIRIDKAKDSFKQTIIKLNRIFKIYKAYLNLCVYGMPIGLLIGMGIGMMEDGKLNTDPVFWVVALVLAAFTLLLTKPIKWLAHYFYGRHISDLKDLVAEIKELEDKKGQ
ncbi:MAG: hypothetical protein AAF363_01475 [Bacteroidota bacterium]